MSNRITYILVLVVLIIIGIATYIAIARNPQKLGASDDIPQFLANQFSDTDFTPHDPSVGRALSGGPSRDGIPAIDDPTFIPIAETTLGPDAEVIVVTSDDDMRAYPFAILTWHEIINDTIDGEPIVVTFCPLCGSAVVYDRTLPNGEITTFGVSGALIDSNLVMFDRATESLWQQTGGGLTGEFTGELLDLVPFQRATIKSISEKHPNARIVSTDTGYMRNYNRNPYSGYENTDEFYFPIDKFSDRFSQKELMFVFRSQKTVIAVPWKDILEIEEQAVVVHKNEITIYNTNGTITITSSDGDIIPYYHEMWFSWYARHGDEGIVKEL